MSKIVTTPKPPYYAVIFTSILSNDLKGYAEMNELLDEISKGQPGFLGMDSCRDEIGIAISYWESIEAIEAWKHNVQHQKAKHLGRTKWYKTFKLRIAKVEEEH